MDYIKHFGEDSQAHLQFRPDYPDALYEYILSFVSERNLVWDCGTGNGQAAVKLANYFQEVIATDINATQLAAATQKKNIQYQAWPAEKTGIKNVSVDLVTIAQALHWFDFDAFYTEVKRVSKPDSIIAAWCYALIDVNPEVNISIRKLYNEILGNQYWPPARLHIDAGYQTIPFPFTKIKTPTFTIEKSIDIDQLFGYLNTWSAVKEYTQHNGKNPLSLIYPELKEAWGASTKKHVSWPIYLLAGRVHKNESK